MKLVIEGFRDPSDGGEELLGKDVKLDIEGFRDPSDGDKGLESSLRQSISLSLDEDDVKGTALGLSDIRKFAGR